MEREIILHELNDALAGILEKFPERLRRILAMRYGLNSGKPHTYAQIGAEFSLSKERVRQLVRKAMRRLSRRGVLGKLIDDLDDCDAEPTCRLADPALRDNLTLTKSAAEDARERNLEKHMLWFYAHRLTYNAHPRLNKWRDILKSEFVPWAVKHPIFGTRDFLHANILTGGRRAATAYLAWLRAIGVVEVAVPRPMRETSRSIGHLYRLVEGVETWESSRSGMRS